MSRLARQLSATGFYHIVLRGINRQHLFEEEKFKMAGRIPMNEEQIRRKIQKLIGGREPYEVAAEVRT
jgi:REP element-mobilizing transposase RayT